MTGEPKIRILLMEDDPGLVRLFERRLTRAGYEVTAATNGEEGLALYAAHDYDVVVLDHVMPTMTGLDVIRALKERGPLPPCIMTTGTGSEQIAVQALKLGASDYLVKDVDGGYLALLPAVIEQAVQQARLQRERITVETALRESQRMLSTLMDNLPGMAYRCQNDAEWTMDFVSSGCKSLTGYQAADLIGSHGMSYARIVHPADREFVQRSIEEGLRQRQPFQCEYRIVTASGEERWVWERGVGVIGEDGEIGALEGLVTDVTDRRHAEVRLREYAERLEEMVEARTRALQEAQTQLIRREKLAVLGQMAGSVGHELRTPLAVIKNAVYLLHLELSEPTGNVAEMLGMINTEIGTADRIVRDLLDFARTGTMLPLSIEPLELIASAVARAQVPDRVGVVIDLPVALPNLLADPVQMEQVLVNLITNAFEAMPDGGTLTLTGWVHPDGKHVVLSVSDTGSGIASEVMEHLFEPLFTTKPRGIGLGLTICRHHVEANGGTIEVTSADGAGTTLTVTLPMADAS